MAGPSPINSACNCCEVPPTGAPTLAFVSAEKSQTCIAYRCGFGAENYLRRVYEVGDGKIETTVRWFDGTFCQSETTCSGSKTVTVTQNDTVEGEPDENGEYFRCSQTATSTTTTSWNAECEETVDIDSTVTSSSSYFEILVNGATVQSDCVNGIDTRVFTSPDGTYTNTTIYDFGSCGCSGNTVTTQTISPEPYEPKEELSEPSEPVKVCAEEFGGTSLPEFIDCTPEGEEPETPNLEDGQGYNNGAYDFEDEETGSTSSQIFKYRVEHAPSATCYLKVWIKRTTETENGTTEDTDQPYEWKGSGYPCYADESKIYTACENIIYGQPSGTISASKGSSISVSILKYSFLEDYEPNDPDENGDQGCKPNGFPIADTSTCSDGEQQ